MAYSGSWLRNAYKDPNAAPVPTADPAHGVTNDPGPAPYTHAAPVLTEVGPIGPYPGSEWVVCTPGTVIDHTDYETHDASTADSGAARQGLYAVPPATFADERYTSVEFDGFGGQDVNPVALRRGLNSFPENNPDGFNPGHAQVNTFAVYRKLAIGQRVHDQRIVTPNTAYRQVNAPPPVNGNPYTPIFGSLAKPFQRVYQRPALRREPPPMSDDVLIQPPDIPAAPVISMWVVG